MDWKFSANAGFFGARRDRFTEYQPHRDLREKLGLISQIEGIQGVELKYPKDFDELTMLESLLEDHNLEVSAVNVDIKNADFFRYGALSARDNKARLKAVKLLQEGMDMAADMGANFVTTCPLADGYDYPFQINYTSAWEHFIQSVREVVNYRKDIKLLLEYQPHEPHARILLNNVGKILHVCAEVNEPNLGANLDVGHSLAAGEFPAESAALLASKGRLFYIHTNDNTGDGGDWDMMSGTVHFWHWLEFLHTLKKIGYNGWLGGDIAPKHIGPVEAYTTNMLMIQRMTRFIDRVGMDELSQLINNDGNAAQTFNYLSSILLGRE